VDYVAPKYAEASVANPNPGNNGAETAKVQAAFQAHRQRVRAGAELVIEMIKGHGVPTEGCGSVAPNAGEGKYPIQIERAPFLQNNYQAVRNNACAWFVVDFSCMSGLTPKTLHELNNLGASNSCGPSPGLNCSQHAAYELDLAVGSASSKTVCTFDDSREYVELVTRAVRSTKDAGPLPLSSPPGKPSIIRVIADAMKKLPSLYSDEGQKYCGPSRRQGY
jgi:hypothetical protein